MFTAGIRRLLFIENHLRAGVPTIARLAPGSLGRAVATEGPAALTSPILAAAALAAIAAVAFVAAQTTFTRRDIP